MSTAQKEILSYKGHPLMRKENIIYYGSMDDSHIIMIQLLGSSSVNDLSIANRVSVQLQKTDPDLRMKDRIIKKTEKENLWSAMDVATIWLDRALQNK